MENHWHHIEWFILKSCVTIAKNDSDLEKHAIRVSKELLLH